jgi:hypothetical protein
MYNSRFHTQYVTKVTAILPKTRDRLLVDRIRPIHNGSRNGGPRKPREAFVHRVTAKIFLNKKGGAVKRRIDVEIPCPQKPVFKLRDGGRRRIGDFATDTFDMARKTFSIVSLPKANTDYRKAR